MATSDPAAAGQMDMDAWRETGLSRREVGELLGLMDLLSSTAVSSVSTPVYPWLRLSIQWSRSAWLEPSGREADNLPWNE